MSATNHVIPLDGDTIDQAVVWAAENMIYSLSDMTESIEGKSVLSFSSMASSEHISLTLRQVEGEPFIAILPLVSLLTAGLMAPSDKQKIMSIPKTMTLTMSDYEDLVDSGTVDPDTYYFIEET